MTPDAIRRAAIDNRPDGWAITGDYTRSEVVEVLAGLRFSRDTGYVEHLLIDSDVRDALVAALLTRRKSV
jgi:hypothetical protein